jgi:hypothetical protein
MLAVLVGAVRGLTFFLAVGLWVADVDGDGLPAGEVSVVGDVSGGVLCAEECGGDPAARLVPTAPEKAHATSASTDMPTSSAMKRRRQ